MTHVTYKMSLNDNKQYCVIDRIEAFKKKWVKLSIEEKTEFLEAYNECRYNPSRNAWGSKLNPAQTSLTLTQFETQILKIEKYPEELKSLQEKIKSVDDNHFKDRVKYISINTTHRSRTPLHNMVAYLMCNDKSLIFFTFKELERYFNEKEEGVKRSDDEKKILANNKTDGGKIPLEMIFPTKETWFKPATCPMNPGKIEMANKIITLLWPYGTDPQDDNKILTTLEKYRKNFPNLIKVENLPEFKYSGGYRKRKTHRKNHRKNHRKTRK